MSYTFLGTVDLSTWIAEGWAHFDSWNWQVQHPDNNSVLQTVNGDPTVFCSDFDAHGVALEGRIRVDASASDDDFIGFTFGYDLGDNTNTAADFLLFDWKQGDQVWDFGTGCGAVTAQKGLAVSRVTGLPRAAEFWGHVDLACNADGGLEELQRGASLHSTGWVKGQEYNFRFEFGTTRFRAYVDNVLEIDLDADGYGDTGRFCFYNFSQEFVRYLGIQTETLGPSSWPSEFPSAEPSLSAVPSAEPSLSALPSAEPSDSMAPSSAPTVSMQPSSEPSISTRPSSNPSLSTEPSTLPSVSTMPSSTPSESTMPSAMPTVGNGSKKGTKKGTKKACGKMGGSPGKMSTGKRRRLHGYY